MSAGERRISFLAHMGMEPMRMVTEKRPFGGPYIRFLRFLDVSYNSYENGAILGRAWGGKLPLLARMLVATADEGQGMGVIADAQEASRKRLEDFGEEEPKSFFELIVRGEYSRLGVSIDGSCDIGKVTAVKKISDIRKIDVIKKVAAIKKVADARISLSQAEPYIKYLTLEGIGFGSCLPELTEKMYKSFHEDIDMETWPYYRSLGLELPEEPPIVTLEEQEKAVLLLVGSYAYAYFPELMKPLDLH